MALTADNARRRQLPRVVRQTLLDGTKPSIALSKSGNIAAGDELRRGDGGLNRAAITAISQANPTEVTVAAHGLTTGDVVAIEGSNSTPSLDGVHKVTVTGANTFTVPVNVTVAGTAGYATDGVPNLRTMLLRGEAAPATDA